MNAELKGNLLSEEEIKEVEEILIRLPSIIVELEKEKQKENLKAE